MANNNSISDVTVNISVEDVVNSAAFGGICLYYNSSTENELYAEVYDYEEAEELLDGQSYKSKLLSLVQTAFSQENVPEKISILVCSVDSLEDYINKDWRYLIMGIDSTTSDILKAAAYIESCGAYKVLAVDLGTDSEGFPMVYDDYEDYYETLKSYERTFAYVSRTLYDEETGYAIINSICTALLAKTSGKSVGSFTYKNQALKGVYADEEITKAQLTEYHSNNVNAFVTKAGYNVTSEGLLANGEYIDILDCKDWVITQIKYQLQQVLIINDKIPYTNTGITQLENCVVNVLKDAFNNGIIAEDDNGQAAYTVNFPGRSETSASDRELRQYVLGEFSFELAGAIHTVTVNGTITI